MKLYEINQAVLDLVDPETDEILDYEAFAELQLAREEKIENMVLWYKDLVADAKAIREEEAALAERRKPIERKAERLKSYIAEVLGGEKFETPRCKVSYRKSSALEIEDVSALAEWLDDHGHIDAVVYSAPSVDKRVVTNLLKEGEEMPGCSLVERDNMQLK